MLDFLGMYRQARTAHARQLTEGTFVSLGTSAMGGRDVCAQGALMALAAGHIANRRALLRTLELTEPLPDAALVLNAYRRWGADYPRRIEGATVTAVIDRIEDRLILTRDRMGAVPVYYAWRGRSAAFSGRPELLLRAGVAGRVVDREGILELFQVAGVSSPMRTPFRDIRRLEPGCVLVADARGTRIKRYASLEPEEGGLCAAHAALLSAIPEAGEEVPVLWHSGGAGSLLLERLAREKYMRPPETLHLHGEGMVHTPAEGGSAEEIAQTEAERAELEAESVGILGFPDADPNNAALLQLAGHSARLSPRALLATGAGALFPTEKGAFEPENGLFPWQREVCHLRFLKPALRRSAARSAGSSAALAGGRRGFRRLWPARGVSAACARVKNDGAAGRVRRTGGNAICQRSCRGAPVGRRGGAGAFSCRESAGLLSWERVSGAARGNRAAVGRPGAAGSCVD